MSDNFSRLKTIKTIVDLLEAKGVSWSECMEDSPYSWLECEENVIALWNRLH